MSSCDCSIRRQRLYHPAPQRTTVRGPHPSGAAVRHAKKDSIAKNAAGEGPSSVAAVARGRLQFAHMATTQRMEKLRAMLDKDAGDPFLLFAMGMEHKKLG